MTKFEVIKRLAKYLKPYRFKICLVLLSVSISTIFMVFAPFIVGNITTTLFDSINDGIFYINKIIFLLILLALLYLISQVFSFLGSLGMSNITVKVMETLRSDINIKMHKLKLNYYDTHTHGDILSVITNDVDVINNTISQSLTSLITQIITAIGILIMMLTISPKLTIIAIVMVPLSLISASGVMKASGEHYKSQQELLGTLNGYIEEMYNGSTVIQTFNYQQRAKDKFNDINNKLKESSYKAEVTSGAISPITTLVNDLGYVLCAAIGCIWAINGKLLVGNVQAMLEYTRKFAEPFSSIASMVGGFGAMVAAGNRIFTLLDTSEEVKEEVNSLIKPTNDGSVSFRNVKFGYTKDKTLMHNVNIDIKPGQKVAIVGPTGAGKTTLINLLMRFYEIDDGEIIVDGVNIKDMTRSDLRDRFGMVLQDAWLFEGTIKDNIGYALDNMPKDKIINCAKSACAHEFIKTLPDAYDFVLSKGAENISQGERQLLTIARAFASDPEILILDEATSNVDTHTEAIIQEAMKKLMKGHTSFIIAHRLSTIKDADMILYMEDGDIKEVGNHHELMKLNGKYAELYNSQFA